MKCQQLKKIDDDVMLANSDVIDTSLTYDEFMIYDASIKLPFLFRVTFYLVKVENRTKGSLTQLLHF